MANEQIDIYSRFDTLQIGTLKVYVTESSGGSATITLSEATSRRYYHGDSTHLTEDGQLPANGGTATFGPALATALNAAGLANTYSVTWNASTGRYTVARATGTATFNLYFSVPGDAGTRMRRILGYSADKTGGTSYAGDFSPWYWQRFNARTSVDEGGIRRRPVALVDQVVAYDGTIYTARPAAFVKRRRWTSNFHTAAFVFDEEDATGDVWTVERWFDHHAHGERFLLFEDGVSTYTHANRLITGVLSREGIESFLVFLEDNRLDRHYHVPFDILEVTDLSPSLLLAASGGTFARSSTAAYFTSAQTMAQAASGTPRYQDRGVGTGPRYLNEGARTNLNTESDDVTTWTSTFNLLSRTDDVAADLFGNTEMGELVSNGAGTFNGIQQGMSSSAQPHAWSCWYKAPSNTGSHAHSLRIDDGVTTTEGNITAGDASTFRLGELYKLTAAATLNGYVFINANGTSGPAAPSGDNIRITGAQAEVGRFASSLIETDGASATRAADTRTYTSSEVPSRLRTGKWRQLVSPGFLSSQMLSGDAQWILSLGGTSNGVRLRHDGTGVKIEVLEAGSVRIASAAITFTSRWVDITYTVDPVAGTLTVAGATTGNGTTTGTAFTWSAAAARMGGAYAGALEFFGELDHVWAA